MPETQWNFTTVILRASLPVHRAEVGVDLAELASERTPPHHEPSEPQLPETPDSRCLRLGSTSGRNVVILCSLLGTTVAVDLAARRAQMRRGTRLGLGDDHRGS